MTEMIAWNLAFGCGTGLGKAPGRTVEAALPSQPPSGWTGSHGPGVRWEHWPRSLNTGLPMMHVLTLWLPADFQRRGDQFPGIAIFAGEGQFAVEDEFPMPSAESTDPFLRDLAAAENHPGLLRRRDLIDGEFAILWLMHDELAAGPTAPRPDLRAKGEHVDESQGTNAWDNVEPTTDIWLIPRVDPNAGKIPVELWGDEVGNDGYVHPVTGAGSLADWAEPLFARSHLGGTAFPIQAMPDGLTPWYLELEEISGLNFGGGGNAQFDLESDTFDWACG
ncbi:hypothetical protein QEH68_04790 [Paenarthrobacter sp. OM7]|uniref:hypothetical protein n=1 Tax=Paenarthrobacter sp. OM7 TaxID=3041264 RepID=UPI00246862B7|nr:hypothetical protein [Paenarthrobacter sp. OM7]WGM21498.1 hypothetical protein QEH68_04790 [Paenarthrobacter sp. OM7]